jgi:hypothetical protein
MKPQELNAQLADWDKRQTAENRKVLVKLAQQVVTADRLADEELGTIDATIRATGVTRQDLVNMVAVIYGYKGRTVVTADDEAKLASDLEAAKLNLKSVKAEKELMPPLARTRQEQEARERWFQRRDGAMHAVREAEAAIKRLEMTKVEAATIEKRHAEVVGSEAK